MLLQKSFGKLGKRAMPRLTVGLDANILLPSRNARATLVDISRKGCRLLLAELPQAGTTLMIKIDRTEALGTVTWVRGGKCGVRFDDPITPQQVERIRWMAEHGKDHAHSKMARASAIWR
jgi:PilZ domain